MGLARSTNVQILACNGVRSVKLDFGPPIATLRVVPQPIAPHQIEFFTPAWPSAFPKYSKKRGCRRWACGSIAGMFARIQCRSAARGWLNYTDHFLNPTVRLGVTGLSRAGKTVFITALIHGLPRGGRFPIFEPFATGRIARARLAPQPDDAVPRFDYENHVRTLIEQRRWPNSTVDISELRLVIDYQRQNGADRTLTLDIVDYPGEWLLDLPLLSKSYEQWSRESLALSRERPRARLAAEWHEHLATLNAQAREDDQAALAAARLFTEYLRACRDERFAMSLLPPGRFLMPGNLAGSPALTLK